jgi:hypothetical protein
MGDGSASIDFFPSSYDESQQFQEAQSVSQPIGVPAAAPPQSYAPPAQQQYAPQPTQYAPPQQAYDYSQGAGLTGNMDSGMSGVGSDSFEDEPPLLEELGIDPNAIRQKLFAVLNPKVRRCLKSSIPLLLFSFSLFLFPLLFSLPISLQSSHFALRRRVAFAPSFVLANTRNAAQPL